MGAWSGLAFNGVVKLEETGQGGALGDAVHYAGSSIPKQVTLSIEMDKAGAGSEFLIDTPAILIGQVRPGDKGHTLEEQALGIQGNTEGWVFVTEIEVVKIALVVVGLTVVFFFPVQHFPDGPTVADIGPYVGEAVLGGAGWEQVGHPGTRPAVGFCSYDQVCLEGEKLGVDFLEGCHLHYVVAIYKAYDIRVLEGGLFQGLHLRKGVLVFFVLSQVLVRGIEEADFFGLVSVGIEANGEVDFGKFDHFLGKRFWYIPFICSMKGNGGKI